MILFKKNIKATPPTVNVDDYVVQQTPNKIYVFKILFTNGSRQEFRLSVPPVSGGVIKIYRGLVKWYFGRPESSDFFFKHRNGYILIQRKNIYLFELTEE